MIPSAYNHFRKDRTKIIEHRIIVFVTVFNHVFGRIIAFSKYSICSSAVVEDEEFFYKVTLNKPWKQYIKVSPA